jgi:hypothetical protein
MRRERILSDPKPGSRLRSAGGSRHVREIRAAGDALFSGMFCNRLILETLEAVNALFCSHAGMRHMQQRAGRGCG